MTSGRTIYIINQSPEFIKVWRELSDEQKRAVLKECEKAEECDVEKILIEVVHGQRRLF